MRGVDGMLPIMLIWIGLPFKELQMKERKAVDQLVLSIALALSENVNLRMNPHCSSSSR